MGGREREKIRQLKTQLEQVNEELNNLTDANINLEHDIIMLQEKIDLLGGGLE